MAKKTSGNLQLINKRVDPTASRDDIIDIARSLVRPGR